MMAATLPATASRFLVALLLVPVLLNLQLEGAHAQLSITATTPQPASGSSPNTFIGTVGSQIASSLLASGTPSLLWGSIPSDSVNAACTQIVNTGSTSLTATVSNSWGGITENLNLQVTATGGCLAAADASGTEAVLVDEYGRQSALVCPSNAGSSGCGIYVTGSDVNSLYSQAPPSTTAGGGNRKLLQSCQSGAASGAITGAVGSILGTAECLALGPLAPFCVIGVVGVGAELGAAGGCLANCFPGDATVQTSSGEAKRMTELAVGDKVAVRKNNGVVAYEDIYAFGHKDATATGEFVKIIMAPTNNSTADAYTKTLELTALHFAPTSAGNGGKVVYKRAKDIRVGDTLWATSTAEENSVARLEAHTVADISTVVKEGLYNPFTVGGTIIVNGVVASVHSEWFLDGVFDSLGLTHLLPLAYQVVLAPARVLHAVLGRNTYTTVYAWLDAKLNVAEFGTQHGGLVALVVSCAIAGGISYSSPWRKLKSATAKIKSA